LRCEMGVRETGLTVRKKDLNRGKGKSKEVSIWGRVSLTPRESGGWSCVTGSKEQTIKKGRGRKTVTREKREKKKESQHTREEKKRKSSSGTLRLRHFVFFWGILRDEEDRAREQRAIRGERKWGHFEGKKKGRGGNFQEAKGGKRWNPRSIVKELCRASGTRRQQS